MIGRLANPGDFGSDSVSKPGEVDLEWDRLGSCAVLAFKKHHVPVKGSPGATRDGAADEWVPGVGRGPPEQKLRLADGPAPKGVRLLILRWREKIPGLGGVEYDAKSAGLEFDAKPAGFEYEAKRGLRAWGHGGRYLLRGRELVRLSGWDR